MKRGGAATGVGVGREGGGGYQGRKVFCVFFYFGDGSSTNSQDLREGVCFQIKAMERFERLLDHLGIGVRHRRVVRADHSNESQQERGKHPVDENSKDGVPSAVPAHQRGSGFMLWLQANKGFDLG